MVALGIVVDAVNEVLDVPENAIEPRPNFGAKIRADFISGIFSHADRFVIVLDIPQVLSVDELAGLAELASNDSDANSGPTN
jgi:purine-binding chemotaxis protein CheW